jgi:hypothetical protein
MAGINKPVIRLHIKYWSCGHEAKTHGRPGGKGDHQRGGEEGRQSGTMGQFLCLQKDIELDNNCSVIAHHP